MRCNLRTHANRKSTSKSRNHLHQFDSRCCKYSQHTKWRIWYAVRFFIWLCCEHLQRVYCQIDKVVFLICRCFIFIWLCCEHLQCVYCQIDKVVFLICRGFIFICSAFLYLVVLWAFPNCICCQNDEVVFLICRCFSICSTLSSRPLYFF